MRAALDRLCPCIAFGFVYCLCDVLVESAYVGVGGVGGAECVAFPDETFGCVGEVRGEVGDITGGDETFGSGYEDMAQLGLPRAGREGRFKKSHRPLHRPGEGVPVCFTEVNE